jgi:nifR3 family TIM-barrel protein
MPFRVICRENGSALSYTEFIPATDIINKKFSSDRRIIFKSIERPVIIQLFGENIERLIIAAQNLEQLKPDGIDINMGCSVKSINRDAGAGLLRDPDKVTRLFKGLSKVIKIPISAKIRLGWDQNNRNYLLISRILEDCGVKMIAVHARTRDQHFNGLVDWDAIAEIKSSVNIPVIGNGDVKTALEAEQMVKITGCDGVMIGRGAIGNPWIFSAISPGQITTELLKNTVYKHLSLELSFYGVETGIKRFRKHFCAYMNNLCISREKYRNLLTLDSPRQFLEGFETFLAKINLLNK